MLLQLIGLILCLFLVVPVSAFEISSIPVTTDDITNWDSAYTNRITTCNVPLSCAANAISFDGSAYPLLAGRSGGQTIIGGIEANDDITIKGTSSATKTTSDVLIQPDGGNVGISLNGAAPSALLHVGSAAYPGDIRIGGTAGSTPTLFIGVTDIGNADVQFQNNSGALSVLIGSTTGLIQTGTGNVGIGVTPGARLQVTADAATTIGQIIKLAATPTADALNIDSSAGSGGDILKVTAGGLVANGVQAVTCTENGTPSTLTITPTSSYIEITNNDTDGCNITMGETGMTAGMATTICIVSNAGGSVTFADTSGVTELAGAFTANIDDCLSLRYGNTTTWREVSRSAN